MQKKVALISGASRGIGLATTHKLLSEDWEVIGISRRTPEIAHPSFTSYTFNLEDLSSLPKFLHSLYKNHPNIDALICNAGKGIFGSLEELSFHDMQSVLHVNFLSHVYLIKTYLPSLKKQERGDIVLMGSEAALQGKKKGSIYCASKWALKGFSQALREECSTSNVRVCLINPGMVQTDFFENLSFAPGEDPLQHLLADDVAKAIVSILKARQGVVFDEINLSPQKKKILFAKDCLSSAKAFAHTRSKDR